MKSVFLCLAMLLGLAFAGTAQNKGNEHHDPATKAKKGAERAAKELNLTKDQQAKWEIAAKERLVANQPIREKLKGSTTPEERKALHSQAKANNDKFEATITTFLTPEQKQKFDEKKKQKQEAMKARHKDGKNKGEMPPELIED